MTTKHIPNYLRKVPSALVLSEGGLRNVAEILIEKGHQAQSFCIFDMDEAYSRIQYFKQIMPRVKIFYSMRRYDNSMMLKLAVSQNVGFSCASPAEIYTLRQLHVSPRNMLYSTRIKSREHIKYAKATGLTHTVFDSSNELRNLKKYWADARLLLCINVKNYDNMTPMKYESNFETEAVNLLEEAALLNMMVIGVTFDGDGTAESYVNSLNFAKKLFEQEKQAGRQMKIVNIGDGFPSDTVESINEVQENDKVLNMFYLTDGMYGTLRYLENPQKIKMLQLKTEFIEQYDLEEAILWGPSGDSLDHLAPNTKVYLPRCTPQDWLVFTDHGSDTITYSTNFSSIPISFVQPLISSNLWNKLSISKVFTEDDFVFQLFTPLSNTVPALSPDSNVSCDSESKYRCHTLSM